MRSQCKKKKHFFLWIAFWEKHARLDWWHFFRIFCGFSQPFFIYFSYFCVHNFILEPTKIPLKTIFFFLLNETWHYSSTFWSISLHAVEGTKSFVNMLLCIKTIKKRSSHNQSTDWFLIRFLRNFIIYSYSLFC